VFTTILALLAAVLEVGPGESGAHSAVKPSQKVDGPPGPYLVLVDPGPGDEFLPAAEAMAALHGASVRRFDLSKIEETLASLRKAPPRFVVFVLPPDRIDVDLVHRVLEASTTLDDDPFPDFEYGFITGRDGKAALRFVGRIEQAWRHEYGRRVTLFGSWEGPQPPQVQQLSAIRAMKGEGEFPTVLARDGAAARRKAAQKALDSCRGKDALLFFSHGYPDEMSLCFRARDLRDWKVDLGPAVLVNCSCYNGAPGRWFAPGSSRVEDRGVVARDDSVALALLDSGVAGYFAGIDAWHGPLAAQVFAYLFDDGLRLGQAAKMMQCRLALEFLPGRIHFKPTLREPERFAGEGTSNRRHNGAGMIFYGDPALAPFAKTASRLGFGEWHPGDGRRFTLALGYQPLLDGPAAEDFLIPMNRLLDYYSVRTAKNFLKELAPEVYRVVPLPEGVTRLPALRVKSARAGQQDVPTGPIQVVVETTPGGNFLHVRVPLAVRAIGSPWLTTLCERGIRVEIEGELAQEP
jgi:hypothetical protein